MMADTSVPSNSLAKAAPSSPRIPQSLKHLVIFIVWWGLFLSPIWLWQYWYLRPLVIYISLMPSFLVFIMFLSYSPLAFVSLFGLYEKYKPVYYKFLMKHFTPFYMRVMHGFEIVGMENIPAENKGALIVFYHGISTVDVLFVSSCIYRHYGRLVGGTTDRGLSSMPLLGGFLGALGFSAGGRQKMIEDLKGGELRFVSPGGGYEAMFSENYSVLFNGRHGFAVAAMEAGVPIIPMFTENLREYQTIHYFGLRNLAKWIVEEYKFDLAIPFGAWPVKLRTHLGKPMWAKGNETAQEFALRVVKALEDLRDAHQKLDGSVTRALLERLPKNTCGGS